jgi:hypothetical protein
MAALTDAELLSMRQMWASRQRKTRSGGKNGGRPVTAHDPDVPAGYVRAFPSTPEQRAALDAQIAALPRLLIPIDET